MKADYSFGALDLPIGQALPSFAKAGYQQLGAGSRMMGANYQVVTLSTTIW